MTPGDVARVLAAAAARDNRTIGDADVLAWHQDIGDLDYPLALLAVSRHYRQTRERIMPCDVRQHVAELADEQRRERLREQAAQRALEAPPPPPRGPVRDRSAAVTALVRQVATNLPGVEADRIHERARQMARRHKGRPDTSRARRDRTKPPKDWPAPQTDEIAAMATRYLLDGYTPTAVAERLAVSAKWCRRTLDRIRNNNPAALEETR